MVSSGTGALSAELGEDRRSHFGSRDCVGLTALRRSAKAPGTAFAVTIADDTGGRGSVARTRRGRHDDAGIARAAAAPRSINRATTGAEKSRFFMSETFVLTSTSPGPSGGCASRKCDL